jgi:glycine/sarcosine N-methyltransferase
VGNGASLARGVGQVNGMACAIGALRLCKSGAMGSADAANVVEFYDDFASDYHLAYGGDWESAVDRQGAALHRLIRGVLPEAQDVLDCSCGIGTQAIGLARRGYRVCGTDISPGEVERARREAERLGADASFDVADFRDLGGIEGQFDVVISCDNAVPHLLDEADVPKALKEMRAKLRPGGLLVITMRDFDAALSEKPPMAPPVVVAGPPRRILLRLHDWDADRPCYTVRYVVLTEAQGGWTVVEHTTRYRAITREELTREAQVAGFNRISWPTEQVVGNQQVMTAFNS